MPNLVAGASNVNMDGAGSQAPAGATASRRPHLTI
jgi:hypothetical protein